MHPFPIQTSGCHDRFARRMLMPAGCQLTVVLTLVSAAGCYDISAMIARVQEEAALVELHEVDLGEYRMSLPQKRGQSVIQTVYVRPFATVALKDREAIESQLQENLFGLRHQIILTLRMASGEDLAEPDLTALRQRISEVVVEQLTAAEIHFVGFREFVVYGR